MKRRRRRRRRGGRKRRRRRASPDWHLVLGGRFHTMLVVLGDDK